KIYKLIEELENDEIDINPTYQRDIVWNSEQQSEFINSVLLGIVPNPIIFNIVKNKNKICIDGKQRITSIKNFVDNKISVKFDDDIVYYSDVEPKGSRTANKLSENNDNTRKMSKKEREYFMNKSLIIVEYMNLLYINQLDVF